MLAQTWYYIELIITDDRSTDNTTRICSRWLNDHSSRFTNTRLLTSKINTGVPANANRGLSVATGKWIKFLGGDDALLPDCLTDNIRFVMNNPGIGILFSRINRYSESFCQKNYLDTIPDSPILQESILWHSRSAESQYRMLLLEDRINFTPSAFMHHDLITSLGGYDERFRLLDDYPLWLNLTKNGHKLYFMDKVTVNYRQHKEAINNTGRLFLINPNYFRSESFRRVYTYPFLPALVKSEQRFRWYASQIFRLDFLNRPTGFNRLLLVIFTIYINPFRYIIKLKKIIHKKRSEYDY